MRKRSTYLPVIRRRTAIALAVLGISTGALIGHYSTDPLAEAKPHSISNPFAHPCKQEGDNGCFWNAKTMGNGIGKSYVVTDSGQVFYFDPAMSADPKHPFVR